MYYLHHLGTVIILFYFRFACITYTTGDPVYHFLLFLPRSRPIPLGTRLLPRRGAELQSALHRSRPSPTWHSDLIWHHVGHSYLQTTRAILTTVLGLRANLKDLARTYAQFFRLSHHARSATLLRPGNQVGFSLAHQYLPVYRH